MFRINDFAGPIGAILSVYCHAAIIGIVNQRRRLVSQGLGSINPYQTLMGLSSAQIWALYGIISQDSYITWSSIIGVALNLYYVFIALRLKAVVYGKTALANADPDPEQKIALEQELKRLENFELSCVFMPISWITVYTVLYLHHPLSPYRTTDFIGLLCTIHYYVYYARYLPHMYLMIRARDGTSISVNLLVADILCSLSWLWYGVVLEDNNLIYPNAAGLVYGAIYVLIYLAWGKSKQADDSVHQELPRYEPTELSGLITLTTSYSESEQKNTSTSSQSFYHSNDSDKLLSLSQETVIQMHQMPSIRVAHTMNMSTDSRHMSPLYVDELSVMSANKLHKSDVLGNARGSLTNRISVQSNLESLQNTSSNDDKHVSIAPTEGSGSSALRARTRTESIGDSELPNTAIPFSDFSDAYSKPRSLSSNLLNDAFHAMDASMEYLANVGRTPTNSMYLSPSESSPRRVAE